MYRVWELTEKEKGKLTRCHWDGDTYYYDVYENQEEYNAEGERLRKIEEEYQRQKAEYLKGDLL